jgi:hypothetical protein
VYETERSLFPLRRDTLSLRAAHQKPAAFLWALLNVHETDDGMLPDPSRSFELLIGVSESFSIHFNFSMGFPGFSSGSVVSRMRV